MEGRNSPNQIGMEKQKEALVRILGSLQRKNADASSFHFELLSDLKTLNEAYEKSVADLNYEFDKLMEVLKLKGEEMLQQVYGDLAAKQDILKKQLSNYDESRKDADELIVMAKNALSITDSSEFNQVAMSLKDRITMSSIFRLSTAASVSDLSCHFVADFSREEVILKKLTFLPVPETPVVVESKCFAIDNCVICEWKLPEQDESNLVEEILPSPIESYVFQYRAVLDDTCRDTPWETVQNIKQRSYVVKDLKFVLPYLQIRVQAWNKSIGGEFSKIVSVSTPAYNFSLDPDACHGNLKVTNSHRVEWDASAVKPVESRIRSANASRPQSPSVSASPKKIKPKVKDRFLGESYTILGDAPVADDDAYFEVIASSECKTYSVGVTSRQLSRYEQLGKTNHSWCVCVNKWIQVSFVAKHNNKMKNLDVSLIPSKLGVYLNKQQGFVSFYDVTSHECLHSFKNIRCSSPLVPGFSIWQGSLEVFDALQVPKWVSTELSPVSKAKSASDVSSEGSETPADAASPQPV